MYIYIVEEYSAPTFKGRLVLTGFRGVGLGEQPDSIGNHRILWFGV